MGEVDPFDAEHEKAVKQIALKLCCAWMWEGTKGLVKAMLQLPNPYTLEPPDEAEQERRWQVMRDTVEEMAREEGIDLVSTVSP